MAGCQRGLSLSKLATQTKLAVSSVGRISEWGGWEVVSPSSLGESSEEGAVPPPQKIFAFFASKSHVFDAL